jgi:hypothetical protein
MEWVEELRASLQRAGGHIDDEQETIHWEDKNGTHVAFRLWHMIPKGASRYVTAYIKGYAKREGWKVRRVKHEKFQISFTVEPL